MDTTKKNQKNEQMDKWLRRDSSSNQFIRSKLMQKLEDNVANAN